ncbi:MAG: ferrochelatase [Polyangiaceae bacterium]
MSRDGVLLTAHGSVENLDDMPEFLARIRHGRAAPPELVAELRRRYAAIGGSPLLRITREQAARLAEELGLPVFVGMRLFRPELVDALREAQSAGVERLVVLPLAPFSVHVYFAAAERARAGLGSSSLALLRPEPFGQAPEFVEAQAELIRPALGDADRETLLLTAHSLPAQVIAAGDPYADQVAASARAIAARLGRPYQLIYQSQGADGGDWLGPDLKTALAAAHAQGRKRLVVAPVGFVSDHVETLYDLDIEAKAWAAELGLEFVRIPAPNAAPALISALASVARRALLG